MKKLLTILLALLVVTGVVFADPLASPAELTLEASKSGVHGLVVGLNTIAEPTTMADWNTYFVDGEDFSDNIVELLEFSDSHLTDSTAAIFAYSNVVGSPKVEITASRLKQNKGTEQAPDNHYIDYKVTYSGGSKEVTADSQVFDMASLSVTSGVTFLKVPFTIEIIGTSWAAATEGDYTTDWAINLVAP